LLALAFPAVAQTPTGSVHGTVFDQQGRALPSASVTLTGKTGARSVDTDNVGGYRFVALDPGRYAVQAELSGFNPKRQEGLQIGIGTQLEIDLVLGVGGIEETVEVVAEAPVVDVESSETDSSLSQDMLFNLPIYGSWRMNYAPGVTAGSAFGADAWSSNALLLDGINTADPEGGGASAQKETFARSRWYGTLATPSGGTYPCGSLRSRSCPRSGTSRTPGQPWPGRRNTTTFWPH